MLDFQNGSTTREATVARNVETGIVYDSKSRNSSSRSHRPASARTVPGPGEADRPFPRAVERVDFKGRGHVVQPLHDDAAADQREGFDDIRAGRDDVAPGGW